MYKTLRNIVLAGVMSAVGSGCVVTPGAMTYGAHLTNPGNAHIANAHGFAVLGDQGYRLAKAKENNYGHDRRVNPEKKVYKTWRESTGEYILKQPLEERIRISDILIRKMNEANDSSENIAYIKAIREAAIKEQKLNEERKK